MAVAGKKRSSFVLFGRTWRIAVLWATCAAAACGNSDEPNGGPGPGEDASGDAAAGRGDAAGQQGDGAGADRRVGPDGSDREEAAASDANADQATDANAADQATDASTRTEAAASEAGDDARAADHTGPDARGDAGDTGDAGAVDAGGDGPGADRGAPGDAAPDDSPAPDDGTGGPLQDGTFPDVSDTDVGSHVSIADAESDDAASEDAAPDGAVSDGSTSDGAADGPNLDSPHWLVAPDLACAAPFATENCYVDPDAPSTYVISDVSGYTPSCPIGPSAATAWFAPGAPPAPGDYPIHAISSTGELGTLPSGSAAVSLQGNSAGSTDIWFGQSGVVHVATIDGRTVVTFDAVPASDGTTDTSISAFIVCP